MTVVLCFSHLYPRRVWAPQSVALSHRVVSEAPPLIGLHQLVWT